MFPSHRHAFGRFGLYNQIQLILIMTSHNRVLRKCGQHFSWVVTNYIKTNLVMSCTARIPNHHILIYS